MCGRPVDDGVMIRIKDYSAPPGCTLLFYETYGKNISAEQELSPRYALLADDSIVQAVPEHPKKEHVFCLSNSHGDVYLFQVSETQLFISSSIRNQSLLGTSED